MRSEWVGGSQFHFGDGAQGSVYVDVHKWCVEGDPEGDEPLLVELDADDILRMAELIKKERERDGAHQGR